MSARLICRTMPALLLCIANWSDAAENLPALSLYTEDLPPFNTLAADRKTVSGWAVEKIALVAQKARLPYTIELTSWARALSTAKTTEQSCVFSTARTAEREPLFKWIGPLASNEWVLYASAGSKPLADLEAVRGARIGGYYQSADAAYVESKGHAITYSSNHTTSLKNLVAGRLDYWVAGRYSGAAVIARNGSSGQAVPVLSLRKFELYLACHPSVPDALVQKLNQTFSALIADGSMARIDLKYKDWTPEKELP